MAVSLPLIVARIAPDPAGSWSPNLGQGIGGHVNLFGIYDQGAWSSPPQDVCVWAVVLPRCDGSDPEVQSFAPPFPRSFGRG